MSPKPALLHCSITLTARCLLSLLPAPRVLSESSWLEVDCWQKISFPGDNKSIAYFRKIAWLQLHHFCQRLGAVTGLPCMVTYDGSPICIDTPHLALLNICRMSPFYSKSLQFVQQLIVWFHSLHEGRWTFARAEAAIYAVLVSQKVTPHRFFLCHPVHTQCSSVLFLLHLGLTLLKSWCIFHLQ